MFRLDDQWIFSATDLVTALRCEYQLLHKRAERAGLVAPPDADEDEVLVRAAALGLAHEQAVLDRLVAEHGRGEVGRPGGVVEIPTADTRDHASLEEARRLTAEALAGGAHIVYQAAFFDDGFYGLADFVVRTPHGYEPADTKFARHAKVEALLQLAAYADRIVALGHPPPAQVHLWLGDGSVSSHRYADLHPILADRSERVRELLDRPPAVPVWRDPELRHCGWCAHCVAPVEATRDVQLVAGVRQEQRAKLNAVGIVTIDDLAAATEPPPGMKAATFAKVHAQAALQVRQDATRTDDDPTGTVFAELADPAGLSLLPAPNPGDVFFDFEGDPLHQEHGWPDLGLEYLFGALVHADAPGTSSYQPWWAHDRADEKRALEEFLDWLAARRATPGFEGLHVYHYAQYEVTALKRMVQRYGIRGDQLDQLLRDGVFVDLYSVVRRAVRVSERSYSIKKLEPLYMGDELRESEVKGGAESIVWYGVYRALAEDGDHVEAARRLEEIRSYNEYDCLSTLRLRDWLLQLGEAEGAVDRAVLEAWGAAERSVAPAGTAPGWWADAAELADRLVAPFDAVPPAERTHHQQAVAMLASALLYHRRESLPFWWDHFRRVGAPMDDWEHDGEMLVLDPAAVEVVSRWDKPKQTFCRTLRAEVDVPASFKLRPGKAHAIYDPPLPPGATRPANGDRGFHGRVVIDELEVRGERAVVTFTESLARADSGDAAPPDGADALPVALSAGPGPGGQTLAAAILAVAREAFDADGSFVPHPALDLVRRVPPRLRGGGALPAVVDGDFASAITDAIGSLDRSYLPVQGPPGTGKSTTGAEVIRRLVVDRGWKVGVVAQSHRTVESLLDKIVGAGVPADRVVKRADGSGQHQGTKLDDAGLRACATDPDWCGVIGGTSFDLVNDKRVPAGSLDLVVVDEAGQFSLADTIAVSRAAPRLLLLGDPQQLPQVSQALHPEPVHRAALSWLSDGHDTLPPSLGYFLDRTYRMHPELCAVSSRLSYEGRLGADPSTAQRRLEGVAPGVRTVLVDHEGNRVASSEEVAVVVDLVDDLLGRTWVDPRSADAAAGRPLGVEDILVVAPYNAQVNRVGDALRARGHHGVAVGTVDKFQGQEAPVVIVTMATSAAASAARGAGFVLSRHRLNVAISRAQHTAFLVHAPQLTDVVPGSPDGLASLGAFLGVSRAGRGAG